MKTAKNVHEAILNVMQRVGYVQKDGEIKSGRRYTFASEFAFLEALRPAMIVEGLTLTPCASAGSRLNYTIQEYRSKSDTTMFLATVPMLYRLYHAPSDTYEDMLVWGMGSDTGDKAVYKAMTGALKYALRQAFLIPTGDDPDHTPSGSATGDEPRLEPTWENIEKLTGGVYKLPAENMTPAEVEQWKNIVLEYVRKGQSVASAFLNADDRYYQYMDKKG